MRRPPILTPVRSLDNNFRICRSTPIGRSVEYLQPVFPYRFLADLFCKDRNEAVGRTREEVVLARLRGCEIRDAEWEELTIINAENQK